MELTENERLMLVKKKEEICGLTLWILGNLEPQNSVQIKKNLTMILSLLNTIASYSDSKNYDLNRFTEKVNALFDEMSEEKDLKTWTLSPSSIEYVCNFANSVRFNFTRKDFKIILPKIDFSIFKK